MQGRATEEYWGSWHQLVSTLKINKYKTMGLVPWHQSVTMGMPAKYAIEHLKQKRKGSHLQSATTPQLRIWGEGRGSH